MAFSAVSSQASSLGSIEKNTTHSGISISNDGEDADLILPLDEAQRLVQRTEQRVQHIVTNSTLLQNSCRLHELPRFEKEDLVMGELIAYGGFSNVYAMNGFNHGRESDIGPGSFVVKNLNPKLAQCRKKLAIGAKDLVMEAHFLSALSHTNIIQLKGWCAAGIAAFAEEGRADGFFLIYERLHATLGQRIHDWSIKSKEMKSGLLGVVTKTRTRDRLALFIERLKSAIDIASAIEYLHFKRIIYRDLKPANVGYDENNVLKLFDFGLAVELPEGSNPDSTFNLAGNTGTPRYMAVEVIRRKPYNVKVDVFSYAVLLWEIMALSKPYDGMPGQHVKEVVAIFGERLSVPRDWPAPLRRIMKRAWDDSIAERPHMTEVREVLEALLKTSKTELTSKR